MLLHINYVIPERTFLIGVNIIRLWLKLTHTMASHTCTPTTRKPKNIETRRRYTYCQMTVSLSSKRFSTNRQNYTLAPFSHAPAFVSFMNPSNKQMKKNKEQRKFIQQYRVSFSLIVRCCRISANAPHYGMRANTNVQINEKSYGISDEENIKQLSV